MDVIYENGLWCGYVLYVIESNGERYSAGNFITFKILMLREDRVPRSSDVFLNDESVFYRSQLRDIRKIDYSDFFERF